VAADRRAALDTAAFGRAEERAWLPVDSERRTVAHVALQVHGWTSATIARRRKRFRAPENGGFHILVAMS